MFRRQLLSSIKLFKLKNSKSLEALIEPGPEFYAWRPLHAREPSIRRPSSNTAVQPVGEQYIYSGPFSATVTRLKQLSLFSCACALASGPIIFGLDASMSLAAKTSVVVTLSTFGVFTTGIMHWFTSPYVHKLEYNPDDDSVQIVSLNLFAKPVKHRFHIAEVRQVDTVHPLSSFTAQGKMFYVDQDNFPDKRLLSRLIVSPLGENES